MTVATVSYSWTQRIPNEPYRERFLVTWSCPNWGGLIQCTLPAALMKDGRTKSIVARWLQVHTASAPAVAIKFTLGFINGPTGGDIYLAPLTTAAAVYGSARWELDAPILVSSAAPFLNINTEDQNAGDDAFIEMWGVLEYEDEMVQPASSQTPQLLPVSVEGYKWPLTRRL